MLLTFVSGLTPPTDPLFAIVGLAVAASCLVAAMGVWTRRLRRAVVVALAGTAPLACLLGLWESTDFEALTIVAVLGWRHWCWSCADRNRRRGWPATNQRTGDGWSSG